MYLTFFDPLDGQTFFQSVYISHCAVSSFLPNKTNLHLILFSFPFSLPQCVVRVCCIRSFGHFLTNLQGNVLHFNPEAGIFTSISQSEQDNLVQQAKAQSRMVSHTCVTRRVHVFSSILTSSLDKGTE